ncbi:hypothetical protein M885DRAFT_575235, partial [Pelagophyceae sp. CCMP2097]
MAGGAILRRGAFALTVALAWLARAARADADWAVAAPQTPAARCASFVDWHPLPAAVYGTHVLAVEIAAASGNRSCVAAAAEIVAKLSACTEGACADETWLCDGHHWTVGLCGGAVEVSAHRAAGGHCSCGTAVALRPCAGGGDSAECASTPQSQTLAEEATQTILWEEFYVQNTDNTEQCSAYQDWRK